MKKHLVYKTRTNGAGGQFYSLITFNDVKDMENYSNAAAGAKGVKSAVNKINKAYQDQYSHCYTSYANMDYLGKFEMPDFNKTKYSRTELLEEVKDELGAELASQIEAAIKY